jgi:acyl CoA:acetate/3-ketoacid CoA transferase alpha subunit/acyl CoA:acetate/3-ketoacid CoA transferase beta subunit
MTTQSAGPPGKVMPLAKAIVSLVRPRDVVLAAYNEARPNAALMQLARSFVGTSPEFTLVTAGMVSVQHALVELGLVTKVIASFVGENYPSARPNPAFKRALAEGRVSIENWSMWALMARLVAGGLGVPLLPVRSMIGSGMAAENGHAFVEFDDPFGSGSMAAVSALRPDITLVHALAADSQGNLILSAPYGEAQWGCLAARRGVIATVEQVVDAATIRRHNALVRVPGHVVRAVCPAPLGAHPYGMFNPGVAGVDDYVDDAAFMHEVFTASRSPEKFRAWIDEWILAVDSHDGYLGKLGAGRRAELVDEAAHPPVAAPPWEGPATPIERQVVSASRQIARRVAESNIQAILSGVGLANLASWMAVDGIKSDGGAVELMAEIGMYGYQPRPGDPFIFSNRNLPTSTMLTDVMTTLGAFVSGPATRALGVLGAGEVDQQGNTASTFASDGAYIVGSGGANDIATGADEVLLTVNHGRLVPRLGYITSPGGQVHSIVSSRGTFERDGEEWVLRRWLAPDGETLEEAVAAMHAESPWAFRVHAAAEPEPEPTAAELALLRSYDPARVFLRTR